jgi:hypothetical protein
VGHEYSSSSFALILRRSADPPRGLKNGSDASRIIGLGVVLTDSRSLLHGPRRAPLPSPLTRLIRVRGVETPNVIVYRVGNVLGPAPGTPTVGGWGP